MWLASGPVSRHKTAWFGALEVMVAMATQMPWSWLSKWLWRIFYNPPKNYVRVLAYHHSCILLTNFSESVPLSEILEIKAEQIFVELNDLISYRVRIPTSFQFCNKKSRSLLTGLRKEASKVHQYELVLIFTNTVCLLMSSLTLPAYLCLPCGGIYKSLSYSADSERFFNPASQMPEETSFQRNWTFKPCLYFTECTILVGLLVC